MTEPYFILLLEDKGANHTFVSHHSSVQWSSLHKFLRRKWYL